MNAWRAQKNRMNEQAKWTNRCAALGPVSDEERREMLVRFHARGGKVTKCPSVRAFGSVPQQVTLGRVVIVDDWGSYR